MKVLKNSCYNNQQWVFKLIFFRAKLRWNHISKWKFRNFSSKFFISFRYSNKRLYRSWAVSFPFEVFNLIFFFFVWPFRSISISVGIWSSVQIHLWLECSFLFPSISHGFWWKVIGSVKIFKLSLVLFTFISPFPSLALYYSCQLLNDCNLNFDFIS